MSTDYSAKWGGGFRYDRSHVTNNKVAVQSYKLLMDYTSVYTNYRVGAYLMKSDYTEFYSLQRLISNFDLFSTTAEKDKKLIKNKYPDYIIEVFGPTLEEQIEQVWRLRSPIWFEFESKSMIKDLFGYKFNKPFRVKIDPKQIQQLEGRSLDSWSIVINGFCLNASFGDDIRVTSC